MHIVLARFIYIYINVRAYIYISRNIIIVLIIKFLLIKHVMKLIKLRHAFESIFRTHQSPFYFFCINYWQAPFLDLFSFTHNTSILLIFHFYCQFISLSQLKDKSNTNFFNLCPTSISKYSTLRTTKQMT